MTRDTDAIGTAIRAATETVAAPPSLRETLAAPPPARRAPWWRHAAALAGVALVVAFVAVIAIQGGPSVQDVAAASLQAPTAPAGDAPAYGDWQPVGARTDSVDGRRAHTVIYQRGDMGAHYAIVEGDPLDLPGSRRVTAHGTTYALAKDGDTNIVAWHAKGKTCILASKMTDLDSLLQFAAWGR